MDCEIDVLSIVGLYRCTSNISASTATRSTGMKRERRLRKKMQGGWSTIEDPDPPVDFYIAESQMIMIAE